MGGLNCVLVFIRKPVEKQAEFAAASWTGRPTPGSKKIAIEVGNVLGQ